MVKTPNNQTTVIHTITPNAYIVFLANSFAALPVQTQGMQLLKLFIQIF